MKLLVAIHDVTPAHERAVFALWAMCRERDIRPALLVVPNWHGEFPLDAYPDFAAWCCSAAVAGAEIFLHGGRHDEVGSPRGWRDEIHAFGRTNREGEFLTLDKPMARARITDGLAMFTRVGLHPVGFVPPAWLSRSGCRDAVTESGLLISEDDRAVYLHRRATRLPSPVVRWSARSAWRARASVAVERAARWRFDTRDVVRIALHPQDLAHPLTAASVERALDHWIAARTPCTYSDL